MWTIPLFISFDEKIPKCGQIVIDRMRNWAEHTVYDIKRILGKNFEDIIVDPSWPFKISSERSDILIEVKTHEGKEKINAERVAGDLLKNIKKSIEEHENRTLTDVVISVPLAISEKQKSATKKAAEYAGWKNINFIPEPVAAAFAYFSKMDIPNKSIILIFDFGGGNVDICIAKIIGDNLKILTYNGDSYLGGSNFDRLLYDHFASILTNEHGINLTQNNNNKFRLTNKCKEIKHSLSSENDSSLDVSDFSPDRDDFIEITRDEFETMSEDLMVRTKNVILRALSNANLQTNDINYVFQVGGGCRMPMVKKLLMETFPSSDHRCSTCPEEVVAHGAAAYAYYLKGLEENIAYFGIDFKASKIAFSESVQSTIESKDY
uniref:Uncharacterized protein n=1 Tax=Panagrolaimus davidi TaxID=227884 RepID=A0A914PUH6_9BILA